MDHTPRTANLRLTTKRHASMSGRYVGVIIVLTVVTNAAYGMSTLLASRPETGYTTLWEGWVQPAATALPAVIALIRAVRNRATRLPWILLAGGLVINFIATLLLAFYDNNLHPTPSPLSSDYLFLASLVFIGGGIVALSHGGPRRASRADQMDALIMGLSVGCIATAMWFQPLLQTFGTTADTIVGLGYPLLDIVLLMIVASALLPTRRNPSSGIVMFLVAIALWATADIIYMRQLAAGTYELGTPLELLWSTGTALFGIATAFPNQGETPPSKRVEPSNESLLPVVFAMFTLVVVSLGLTGRVPAYAAFLGVIAIAVALARVSLTVRELTHAHAAHHEARVDELTKVLNRRGFFEELEGALAHPSDPWALVMIDLDGFKEINDSLGHHAGDELLTVVGNRFAGALPSRALLGRLGGDEFVVAIPTEHELAEPAVRSVLATLDQDIEVDDHRVRVSASAGVAGWPHHGFTPEAVFRCADAAMYAAKRNAERIRMFSGHLAETSSKDHLVPTT